MAKGTILVIRATGSQGCAVTSHLLKNGFIVHALVRNAKEDRAIALESIGATLFQGEIDDAKVISLAIAGCTGLFLNMMPSFQDDLEVQQSKQILDVAKSAGVIHLVYSSSLPVGKKDGGQHWDPTNIAAPALKGKQDTEEIVRQAGFQNWTILRPGYFMTNLTVPLGPRMFPELGTKGEFVSSYHPDTVLPLIDPDDIGAFATAAFLNPYKFGGKEIPFAGELMAVKDIVILLAKAAGKSVKAVYRTEEESAALAKVNPLVAGQLLSLDMERHVDMEEVLKWGVPVRKFEEFLEKEHDRVEKTFEAMN